MLQKKTSKLSAFFCIDIQKKRTLKSRFPQNFCAVFLFKINCRGKYMRHRIIMNKTFF